MPLLGTESQFSANLQASFAPWNGTQMGPFAEALAKGVATGLSSQITFTTTDVGTVAGAGVGTGTGIMGLQPEPMSQYIFNKGQEFWASKQTDGPGAEWKTFCDKFAKAACEYLKQNAALASAHAPVGIGVGTVTAYKAPPPDLVAAAIVAAGPPSWASAEFPKLALAVATGICKAIDEHKPSDMITIAGSVGGTPAGGAGAGTGKVN